MEKFNRSAVKVILFDVYGTLVTISNKRAPFRQLIKIGAGQGRMPNSKDAEILMGQPIGLLEAGELLGIALTDDEREQLKQELVVELESILPFVDTLPALYDLKNRGYKLGLCSNLAKEYAEPVLSVLPPVFDAYVWSFDAGAIKPNPAIYAHACRQLRCLPCDVLMVGDTLEADVEGPRAFGMQALLLDRKQRSSSKNSLSSLLRLCEIVERVM
ncbi:MULTISPECIES: HAD family hydrolase [Massilia]|jgi:HAD superfamily hydrolase (TIGR01549 family)|uniref:HAD family hydrolase n=1 Tax=Massilia TaxID=149698 RepID=UPI0009FDC927|nr:MULTISPECIES: HAD family hydrolase [Massilia]